MSLRILSLALCSATLSLSACIFSYVGYGMHSEEWDTRIASSATPRIDAPDYAEAHLGRKG